jgi:kynurenine formamidase
MKIIDLTHTFTDTMPIFPGDNIPQLKENIDTKNNIVHYHLETSMHVGTHMDAPYLISAWACCHCSDVLHCHSWTLPKTSPL